MIPSPVIKFEVDQIKHTMALALSQYTSELNDMLQRAVDNFCTVENLETVVAAETERVLSQVIKEKVSDFFKYGNGRQVIKAAVEEKLKNVMGSSGGEV